MTLDVDLGQEQLERALESADMRVVGGPTWHLERRTTRIQLSSEPVDFGDGCCMLWMKYYPGVTPLKFNMEPENGGLEDDVPFQLGDS